ncbi:Protein bric-a-brac 2 [Camponotus floridanus]|uniref:Protein bric-a-brac 2 n=1 Tax=Camponotus floridanus TaxID=104421 RepID=E2AXY2_CAMFO|nr:Protein bric-a-brac 2 [Camponotus floridanus]
MKSKSEDPEKRTGSHSGSSFLPPDRGAMCIADIAVARVWLTKSASRGILLSVGPKPGRAIGHERDQEGKYPLEGGCERGGEGHGVESKGGIMDSHQQQFCLKWNSFGSNLATTFSNLFKSESLTDVTLFCEAYKGKIHNMNTRSIIELVKTDIESLNSV